MPQQLVDRLGVDILKALAPGVPVSRRARQGAIIAALGPALPIVLPEYDIVTPRRIEHFLAQAAHETAGFSTTEELGGPSYFARYDGREDLGNVRPGDGARYHGRGIFQLTGRANYRRIGGLLGLDLEGNPELASDPVVSLRIACLYWNDRKIGPMAEDDDLLRVTRAINGGKNGLDDRRRYLGIAKREVARLVAAGIQPVDAVHYPVLRRGSEGNAVEILQVRLRQQNFPLTLDGEFGPATELAVKAFQGLWGLSADGVVGPKTWAALIPREGA
jgi:putative chitinase